jgi:hypothetical protein
MRKQISMIILTLFAGILCFSQPVINNPTKVTSPKITQVKNAGLISEYRQAMANPALVSSYRWFTRINPTNLELDPLTDATGTNRDTGIVNYSKRTSISLVGWLNGNNQDISDDSLVHLKPLINLEHIIVSGFTGNQGVAHLSSLKNLKTFRFSRTGLSNNNLTEEGLRTLALLTNLQYLELPPLSRVNQGGYTSLRNLVKLYHIKLIKWSVPSSDLSFLAYMKNLKKIDLSGSSIKDEAFAYLNGHPMIESINLEFDSITNKSLVHLTSFRTLKEIVLNHTQLDIDKDYNAFKNFVLLNPNLKSISLYGVRLSNENLNRLRADCPGVAFYR